MLVNVVKLNLPQNENLLLWPEYYMLNDSDKNLMREKVTL